MLSKLLKYEYKATSRIFIPLYIGLIFSTILNKLIFSFDIFKESLFFISTISMLLYISMIVAVFIFTFIIIIQRFYKNLLSDEGYLMFTLPVKQQLHIKSKLIVSLSWIVSSLLTVFLSIFILVVDNEFWISFPPFLNIISKNLYDFFGNFQYLFIILTIIAIITLITTTILMIFASISIGHLFYSHRLLGSFVGYMILYIITQIISGIILSIIIALNINVASMTAFINNTIPSFILLYISLFIIYQLIYAIGYYYITKFVITKKLNLE